MKRRSGEVLIIENENGMYYFRNFYIRKGIINGQKLFPLLDELNYRNVDMLKADILQICNLPVNNIVWNYV